MILRSPGISHQLVRTTDLFQKDGKLHWRIHLVDGRSVEASDAEIRKYLRSRGEKMESDWCKISYRKFAVYAVYHLPKEQPCM